MLINLFKQSVPIMFTMLMIMFGVFNIFYFVGQFGELATAGYGTAGYIRQGIIRNMKNGRVTSKRHEKQNSICWISLSKHTYMFIYRQPYIYVYIHIAIYAYTEFAYNIYIYIYMYCMDINIYICIYTCICCWCSIPTQAKNSTCPPCNRIHCQNR